MHGHLEDEMHMEAHDGYMGDLAICAIVPASALEEPLNYDEIRAKMCQRHGVRYSIGLL